MLGIYFSGTGNTKYCITRLSSSINEEIELIDLFNESTINKIKENDKLIIACPTQFSNIPYAVRDFIITNKDIWKNKQVILLITMGAFAGDVTGCGARLLKKFGATILGGMQIRMPDSVSDVKALKKSFEVNKQIVKESEIKIDQYAKMINEGKYPQQGLSFFSHLVGLFGQRLWFYNKSRSYKNNLKINSSKCVGCSTCVYNCPMENLVMNNKIPQQRRKCTMCYRCIANCPKQAITLLGKEVIEQVKIENYID